MIVDDKPCICEFEGEMTYMINDANVKIFNFIRSGPVYNKRVKKQLKASTCKNEKLEIKSIGEVMKARVEEETVNKTGRFKIVLRGL